MNFQTDRPHQIVLPLSEKEKTVLADLAAKKDMSEVGVLRLALRLYQLVESRVSNGETFSFRSPFTRISIPQQRSLGMPDEKLNETQHEYQDRRCFFFYLN